jgi:hypothetical protein
MKKITVLFVLNAITFCFLSAQITITNVDMPSVSDTFRLSETNDIQGINQELTGANYSWNYTALLPTTQRIDTFFSVTSTPLAYQFYFNNNFLYPNHKASYALRGMDIGITQVPITEVFNYIKNSSSAYDNVGFGSKISGVPSSTQNDPIDREYEFPMNYNDNHISNSDYGITVPGFGYYGQEMERIDTVDGWGTLALPNGNYDVLRVKSILNKIDTTYIDQFGFGTKIPRAQEIEYKWLAAGTGIPVLKVITNAGFVSQIEYQDDFVNNVSVAEKNKLNKVNIFPNPTTTNLVVSLEIAISGLLQIHLKDVTGKKVALLYNKNMLLGNNKLKIDLTPHSIQSGIYFVELLLDKQAIYTEKLIVLE